MYHWIQYFVENGIPELEKTQKWMNYNLKLRT